MLSIVIATHNRTELLKECLKTISRQHFKDFEIIIAHSGNDDGTEKLITEYPDEYQYFRCKNKGAAVQRNEGVEVAKGEWIVFLDDDVLLESDFLFEINQTIINNPSVKGISGRITNQYHTEPSKVFRLLLRSFGIGSSERLDGKVVGPALNFLPNENGLDEESIDWMPTCVCAYNRQWYINAGGFPSHFVGYSFGEDLFLSLLTSSQYPMLLNRKAKLFHKDIGSNSHKNHYKIAVMQVDNRNYINDIIIKKNRFIFNLQLICWNFFTIFAQALRGKIRPLVFLRTGFGYVVGYFKNSFK
jgi:glycosyltransferase involved in cell wall biosynthesis